MIWAAFAWAEPGTLEQAYQKEFAYLSAEKAELDARLAELDRDADGRIAAADAELEALQARLVATTRAADRAEDAFDALERETAAMDDADVLLKTTLDQAAETLGVAGDVDAVFAAAAERIESGGRIGWSDESFFLANGEKIGGRVYRWGRVAAWGIAEGGAGSLVPVADTWQLRSTGATTALALRDGEPAALDMQLHEPERAVEEAEKSGGLRQVLDDAGAMGKVLFGLGCISVVLVVVRGLTLLVARRGGSRLVVAVTACARSNDFGRAGQLLGRRRSPTARVLGAILDAEGSAEMERVVDEAILKETPAIDRFASALVVITAGAPLMGLLGTVTGMIATFDVITEHGTGNPKLMSAGIAEALVCTALGLAVAIPTLLAGNVLASLAENVKHTLERGALAVLNALELRGRRSHATGEAAK